MDHLISAHGGTLINLIADPAEALQLKSRSVEFPSIDLTDQQLCDLELLMNGAFSPLEGFLARADYDSVLERSRLADNTVWPMPIVLAVPPSAAEGLSSGARVALRDGEGNPGSQSGPPPSRSGWTRRGGSPGFSKNPGGPFPLPRPITVPRARWSIRQSGSILKR